jgi:long-chain acyl-CoA synthetase
MGKFNKLNSIGIYFFSILNVWLINACWLGKVSGLKNLPKTPCIIISNHESYLDFILLGYVLRKKAGINFTFWAKTKVIKHILWKTYSNIFSTIEVYENGTNRKLNELSIQVINGGSYVCIFPEGRRTRNGELQNFKEGYLYLAAAGAIEIVPVFLENTFKAWPMHQKLPKPKRCNITFLPSFHVQDNLNEIQISDLNARVMEKYHQFKSGKQKPE